MPSNYQSLDAPPPSSRFRRPWSPEPFTTADRSQALRREPSDSSVEALDLADYARRQLDSQSSDPLSSRPPSSHAARLFSRPSLYSQTSMSKSQTGLTSPTLSSFHRPYSLPSSPLIPQSLNHDCSPRIGTIEALDHHDPCRLQDQETEIDIGNFPSFSRHWYKKDKPPMRSPLSARFSTSYGDGLSPFDPSFSTHRLSSWEKAGFSDLDHSVLSSQGHRSSMLLPWANGIQDQSFGYVEDDVKQERIQMLEREFARVGKPDAAEPIIGSLDERGMLITDGPKKRTTTRVLQVIMTLGTAVAIIYASLATHPATAPPPQGTAPVYILYALSILTFFAVIYMSFIYPTCCMGRRNKSSSPGDPLGLSERLMVLPVQQLPGGSKYKGGKKKKKEKKGMKYGYGGDIQVNLVVDPTMFSSNAGSRSSEDEESLGYGNKLSGGRNSRPKRVSVFEGLALEARWKTVRKFLKWSMAFDLCCLLLWGVEFFVILFGQRCPSGQFAGWCDAYNFATALTCFAFLLFGFSVFFDIKDIHSSRISPRTRT